MNKLLLPPDPVLEFPHAGDRVIQEYKCRIRTPIPTRVLFRPISQNLFRQKMLIFE